MEKTEDKTLSESFLWLWNTKPELRGTFWHVANERNLGGLLALVKLLPKNAITEKIKLYLITEGGRLKAKGVLPGVPDLEFHYQNKTYFFEFKTETCIVSKEQKEVHTALNKQGFTVYIVKSLIEFKTIINELL